MRGTLRGVRARVDRLTSQWGSGAGCPVCREDEARMRYRWVRDVQAGGVGYQQDEDPSTQSVTCAQCGRTYALSYLTIGWRTRTSHPAAPRPV